MAGYACATHGDCPQGACLDLHALCFDPICGTGSVAGQPAEPADVQCHYFGFNEPPQPGEDPGQLFRQPISQISALLDGITEYSPRLAHHLAGSFCSGWNGDLLLAGIPGFFGTPEPGRIRRFMNPDTPGAAWAPPSSPPELLGTQNLNGANGLDVVVGADGTIYMTDFDSALTYLRPITHTSQSHADFFRRCGVGEVCLNGTTCAPVCTGDCNLNLTVAGDELAKAVQLLEGFAPLGICPAVDVNRDTEVFANEVIQAAVNAGDGCPNTTVTGAGLQVALDIGEVAAPAGQAVAVPFSFSGGGGVVGGFQMDVLYDSSLLSVTLPDLDCSLESGLTGLSLYASDQFDPPAPPGLARLRLFVADLSYPITPIAPGVVARCIFVINPGAQPTTTYLTGERQQAANTTGGVIASTVPIGSVTVTSPCVGCGCGGAGALGMTGEMRAAAPVPDGGTVLLDADELRQRARAEGGRLLIDLQGLKAAALVGGTIDLEAALADILDENVAVRWERSDERVAGRVLGLDGAVMAEFEGLIDGDSVRGRARTAGGTSGDWQWRPAP